PGTREADAAAGALEVAKGAFDIDEGAQAIPAPIQAPQPPPATGPARVHGIREALGEQREVSLYGVSRFLDTTYWSPVQFFINRRIPEIGLHGFPIFCTRPRWKEIDNVGEVSIIWNSCSYNQHGESTE
ncbi:hypothetical protein Tco_0122942, partial [Tanacetum coccineum]